MAQIQPTLPTKAQATGTEPALASRPAADPPDQRQPAAHWRRLKLAKAQSGRKLCRAYSLSTLALFLALLFMAMEAPAANAQLPQYSGYYTQHLYVWDGTDLMPLYNTEGITCDHWAVFWQFPKGAALTPPHAYSATSPTDSTAAEAEAEYQKALQQAQSYEDWERINFGLSVHATDRFRPSLGPVCMVRRRGASAPSPVLTRRVAGLAARLRKDQELASRIVQAFQDAKTLLKPYAYEHGKTALQNYIEGLRRAEERADALDRRLNQLNSPPLARIEAQLSGLNAELNRSEAAGNVLARSFGHSVDTSWSGKTATSLRGDSDTVTVTPNGFVFGRQVTQKYGNQMPNGAVQYTTAVWDYSTTVDFSNIRWVNDTYGDNRVYVLLKRSAAVSCSAKNAKCGFEPATTTGFDVTFLTPQDAKSFIAYIKQRAGQQ